jgi:hypothetical protein
MSSCLPAAAARLPTNAANSSMPTRSGRHTRQRGTHTVPRHGDDADQTQIAPATSVSPMTKT